MDERIAVVVTAEGTPEGELMLIVQPVGGIAFIALERVAFSVSVWFEDTGVRMSLRNPRTGGVAYLQGSAMLLSFLADLGLRAGQ